LPANKTTGSPKVWVGLLFARDQTQYPCHIIVLPIRYNLRYAQFIRNKPMDKKLEKYFHKKLLNFSQESSEAGRQKIEDELWENYGAERVVFILDMSGFSLLTRKYGIIHYLSMVRRMQLIAEPIVASYEGTMIKFEADNCFAIFPDTFPAIQAAIALQFAFDASNLLTSDDFDVHIACGIDYGKVLIIGNEDCFGDPVNRACKLGEDTAAAGEILVTKEAMQRLPLNSGIKSRPLSVSISGLIIPTYTIDYRA
jgi:class 3 adenylate cyclase